MTDSLRLNATRRRQHRLNRRTNLYKLYCCFVDGIISIVIKSGKKLKSQSLFLDNVFDFESVLNKNIVMFACQTGEI